MRDQRCGISVMTTQLDLHMAMLFLKFTGHLHRILMLRVDHDKNTGGALNE